MMDREMIKKAVEGNNEAFLQVMQGHRDVLYKTASTFRISEETFHCKLALFI